MRIRLDIAYDGTHFRGWAVQPGLRTVQGTIESALARILGGQPRLVVAGRTDAGVHASGQVAHLDLDEAQVIRLRSAARRGGAVAHDGGAVAHDGSAAAHDSSISVHAGAEGRRVAVSAEQTAGVMRPQAAAPDPDAATDATAASPGTAADEATETTAAAAARLAARIRGVLGAYSDVAVQRTSLAPEGFDARFSAVWRRYAYRVADADAGYDPLERHRTTTVRGSVNEGAMDAAARSLIGLHDFAAYCKPREESTTIRTLLEFDWRRDAEGVLVANVKADAFCHSMVRALVGACVAVGQGRLGVEDVAAIRDRAERTNEFTVLAARGLTLTEVGYPLDELLGARAEQTRARRDREHSDRE